MKSVGIRELKNHLSQYLNLVKNGETVIVKNHNRVIAEIRQPSETKWENQNQSIENYLDKLESQGKLHRADRSSSIVDTLKSTKKISNAKWYPVYKSVREDRS